MKPPRWAINAANRFSIPGEGVENAVRNIDWDRFAEMLVALQLRAYRRGVGDAVKKIEQYNRGKTAEEKK
jgi:hypothetical protein